MRPLRASLAFLRPVVRLTSVLPTLREGGFALAYRSWFVAKVFEVSSLLSLCELVGCLDVVPIFPAERVDCALLKALLALGQALVLADGHDGWNEVKSKIERGLRIWVGFVGG